MRKSTGERLVEKLEAAFAKLGILAENISIDFPQGFWKQADVYRWEGYAKLYFQDGRDPKRVQIMSWDTATECVAKGELLLEERSFYEWEIHSPASQVMPEA